MQRIFWEISVFGAPLPVPAYGVMILVGFLSGLHLAVRRGRTVGVAGYHVHDLSLAAILSGLAGARLFHVLENSASYDFSFLVSWRGVAPSAALAGAGLGLLAAGAAGGRPGRRTALLLLAGALVALRVAAANSEPLRSFPLLGVGLAVIAAGALAATNQDWIRSLGRRTAATWTGVVSAALIGAWATTRYLHADLFDWRAFAIWEGGLVFYGGFLLAGAVTLVMARSRGLPVLGVADLLSPSVAVALAFARLGCFYNGCCWGRPCPPGVPGIRYPAGSLPATVLSPGPDGWTVPTWPAPVLSSVLAFALFLFLSRRFARRGRPGEVFCLLLAFYSAGRFAIEFLRHDTWISRPYDPVPLTTSQYVSAAVLVVAGAIFVRSRRFASGGIESPEKPCNSPI